MRFSHLVWLLGIGFVVKVAAAQTEQPELRLGEKITIKGQVFHVEKKLPEGRLLLAPPLPPTASLGAFITPVGASQSSFQNGTPASAMKTIDGSGWSETFRGSGVYVHSNNVWAGGGTMWVSDGGDWKGWVQYDLGRDYNVNGVYVWNFNEAGEWRTRSINKVRVSASGDAQTWEAVGDFDLEVASGTSDYKGQTVPFGKKVKARYFKLQSLGNYRNGEQTGLAEVRFSNADEKAVIGVETAPKYPRPQHPALALGQPLAGAENMVFPAEMKLVDVTKPPYNAKGDGKTDDTAALQKALDAHNNTGAYVYLPNGVYIISKTLRWPGDEPKNLCLQGQSQRGTIIKLKDSCPGFEEPSEPQAMIWCGKAPAQRFGNEVRNLTFDTGVDNPGAIGARFMANNQGGMFDVTIISGDGYGVAGLDLAYTDEQGPELIKNLRVVGFDYGIKTSYAVASVTMENITVEKQNVAGVSNGGQPLTIGNFKSDNQVPAITNSSGLLTLIGAEIRGSGAAASKSAIFNNGWLLLRDVETAGYRLALENKNTNEEIAGPQIEEYRSSAPKTLGGTAQKTLRLPVKQTPVIDWEPLEKWISVTKFGATPGDDKSDSDGIQAAIDSGATTVYLPRGSYKLDKTIIVRGNVRRFIGGKAWLSAVAPLSEQHAPMLRFENGTAPVVVIERLITDFAKGPFYFLEHAATRTLLMHSLQINLQGPDAYRNTGSGDVFLEDVVGQSFLFTRQNVWARQLNPESSGTKIVNDGATLWILGLKVERPSTIIHTKNRGKTEVLGGLSQTFGAPQMPMFISENSDVSLSIMETDWEGTPYMTLMNETRDGQLRTWRDETKLRGARALFFEGHAAP